MNINRRHKAILFITLVLTGSALLAGTEIEESLGMLMLGVALAWAVGSDTASRTFAALRSTSNLFYRWARLPLVTAFAGCVLGVALTFTRANVVAAIAAMCATGIAISPLTTLPTQRRWARIACFLVATASFFGGLAVAFAIYPPVSNFAERSGEVSVIASVALLVGIYWLSRGSALIRQGITAGAPEATISGEAQKRVRLQYISLLFGVLILTIILAMLTFLASSNWAFSPPQPASNSSQDNTLGQTGVLLLFASWPYFAWKRILSREPNSNQRYLRKHKRITSLAGMFFVVAMSLAVTFGIQNGNDRILVDRVLRNFSDLNDSAVRIGQIKQRNLRTVSDYVEAYSEVEPLLDRFDVKLEECSSDLRAADSLDQRRGLINIQKLHTGHTATMQTIREAIGLDAELSQLIRREVSEAKRLAELSERDQVGAWETGFRPLLVQEDALREKFLALQKED